MNSRELPPGSYLSGLVNNAGVIGVRSNDIRDTDILDIENVFKVNVRGTFNCVKEAEKIMSTRPVKGRTKWNDNGDHCSSEEMRKR